MLHHYCSDCRDLGWVVLHGITRARDVAPEAILSMLAWVPCSECNADEHKPRPEDA